MENKLTKECAKRFEKYFERSLDVMKDCLAHIQPNHEEMKSEQLTSILVRLRVNTQYCKGLNEKINSYENSNTEFLIIQGKYKLLSQEINNYLQQLN